MSFGKELIESAEQALAIAKGDMKPGSVHVPESIDVAGIRRDLGLSQGKFAEQFGLPVGTVRDWEQNRRSPDRAAMVLLSVIAKEPDAVQRAIASST